MTQTQHPFPFAALPVFNPFAFWQSFATVAKSMEPAVKTMAKANMEVVGLVSSRTRASLEHAQSLSRCRTPQEIIAVQTRFFETARENYVAAGQRIATTWQGGLGMIAAAAASDAAPSRDYMSLPDVQKADPFRTDAVPAHRSASDDSRRAAAA